MKDGTSSGWSWMARSNKSTSCCSAAALVTALAWVLCHFRLPVVGAGIGLADAGIVVAVRRRRSGPRRENCVVLASSGGAVEDVRLLIWPTSETVLGSTDPALGGYDREEVLTLTGGRSGMEAL